MVFPFEQRNEIKEIKYRYKKQEKLQRKLFKIKNVGKTNDEVQNLKTIFSQKEHYLIKNCKQVRYIKKKKLEIKKKRSSIA